MATRPPLMPHAHTPGDSPDLPVRQRGDFGEPEYLTKASLTKKLEQGVCLCGTTRTGECASITVTLIAPGIVRVLLETEDLDPKRVRLTKDEARQTAAVSIGDTDGGVTLMSDEISVQIDLDPFHISYSGPDGEPLLTQNNRVYDAPGYLTALPFGFTEMDGQRVAFHDTFNAEPDEHFYGFGEKFTDFDKRGQRLEMWVYDPYGTHTERTYKPVPFFISSRGYGIFVDSISCIHFDMAHSNNDTFSLVVPDSALDYYIITGPSLKDIISRYADLVSFPILPPKWAFGLWMSSGFKRDSAAEVACRARQIRQHQIPCDVLHLDCYWQKLGRWSDMAWDQEMFPDPEGMIQEIKARGFKICLWINPYIGIESPRFTEGDEKGYFLKNAAGETYTLNLWGREDEPFHPPVAIVDMTNPAAKQWYGDLLRPHLRMGIDVYKTDFGEGVPLDAVAHNGMSGQALHNLYTLIYNDLVSGITVEEIGGTGMVWGRSTYAGGQRHAAQWGGDTICTYQGLASTMRGGLSIGASGHPFWSHDIGGFHLHFPDRPEHEHIPPTELYVRWVQFGTFSPLSRMHGVGTRLPWDYGKEALDITRDYIRLRYRLLPYLYTYASRSAETSQPMMRAMILEFPDDPICHTLDLQYMLGAELLVAPIYNSAGRRPVYLPAGRWIDFWTHEIIEGPQMRHVAAPLEKIPLYVRANTLLPTIEPPDHLSEEPFDLVIFDAYLLDQGRFELRDTDGVTRISAILKESTLDIRVEGVKQKVGLRLIPLPAEFSVEDVRVNEVRLDKIDSLTLQPDAPAGWSCDQNGAVRVMIHR